MEELGYSLESYKLILSTFQSSGFQIVPLRAPVADEDASVLYLRHDVDYNLEVAERMAEANQELGVSGCFFVNPRCPLYNVACEDSLGSVARIRALGQTIGLHVTLLGDEVESIVHDADRIARYVQREHNLLSSIVGEVEPVMSWHNPSLAGEHFQDRLCNEIRGIFNAYSLSHRGVAYMGDTNHRYSTAQWLDAARSGQGSIQATFHPYTWVLGAPTMEETLARTWPLLIRRCEKEFMSNHTYRAACPDGLPAEALSRWVDPLYRSALTRDRAV